MAIKMVALDLDGTTLNSDGKISDRTRATLEEAGRQGVHIVVSTGRSYLSLPVQAKSIDAIEYAITSNGAHINIMKTGEAIYNDFLSEKAVYKVAELARSLDTKIEIFVDGRAYIDAEYYDHIKKYGCSYRNAEYVLWSRTPVPDIIGSLIENKHKIENVNFCFRSIPDLEKARPQVEMIPEATITSSFANNLEVGGPNTSKKTALKALMSMLDVKREELMCCGDAPNDIEMIEFAGLGVAVGNAWGGTKSHADHITGTNDEDGVAMAIEKFVLNK
ncbi:MAG: HAD family phosphatase [Mogibacterium sp.]|nr:HAD family phosphatase [Mogibacterium sp.]